MQLGLFKKLLSIPTAPFREAQVRAFVGGELLSAGVPFFEDAHGNLVVGAKSARHYASKVGAWTKEPLRVFVAHMDHPGFHGVKWLSEDRLSFKWFGGSPTQDLIGATFWLANEDGYVGEGKVTKIKLIASKRAIDKGELKVRLELEKRPKATELFGSTAFRAPVWQQGQMIYTKAADDLAGVFAILSTAKNLYKKKNKAQDNFLAVLTRGEEVGFIGAIAHFELGWLKERRRSLVCVSLEASRTLPKAEIGKGPIVRVGDRMTAFDPGGTRLLTLVAQKKLKGRFQKRLMDGGACEATAATAYGLKAIGLTLPLGNYHNQNLEGGPDSRKKNGPAPEFIHLRDLQGMLKLCEAIVQPGLNWHTPWEATVQKFRKSAKAARRKMKIKN